MAEAILEDLDLLGRDMVCSHTSPAREADVAEAWLLLFLPSEKRSDQVAEEGL
jgi:hypothetical protein